MSGPRTAAGRLLASAFRSDAPPMTTPQLDDHILDIEAEATAQYSGMVAVLRTAEEQVSSSI